MEGSLQYCRQLKNSSQSNYQCCKQFHHFQYGGEQWLHWLRHSCKDPPMQGEQTSSILRERLCYTLVHRSDLTATTCTLTLSGLYLSFHLSGSYLLSSLPEFLPLLQSSPLDPSWPITPLKLWLSSWLCSAVEVCHTLFWLVTFLFAHAVCP